MEYYGLHLDKKSLAKGIFKETPLSALAFFLGAPQGWRPRKYSDKQINIFKTSLNECETLSPDKVVVHGCYLMNPASERADVVKKTDVMFINELDICDKLGVGNYVFHPGVSKDTQKGLQFTVDLINKGLTESKDVNILVENMTQTNRLCQTWEECEWVLKHIKNRDRFGFCLDTAHCWGAGNKKGMFMDTLLNDFDNKIGIEYLKAVHLNDSKVEYGSNVDRHEDILLGKIPYTFWDNFIFDKRIKNIPAILETPSNCLNTVKIIIENGCVPNSSKKDKEKVRVNIIKQSSMDNFLVKNTNKKVKEIEHPREKKIKKPKKLGGKYNFLNKILGRDMVKIVKSYLSRYEDLEELLPEEWKIVLFDSFNSKYFMNIKSKLIERENRVTIYPPVNKIFNAFNFCKPSDIKVVILGQDPYIKKGQAEGLSFSVMKGCPVPPSLKRIYKELETDIKNFKTPWHGSLIKWAEQGVLLLNATLTVDEGKSNSHKDFGWQQFTDFVLKWINNNRENVVFILMGKFAQKKCSFINKNKHYIIETVHPSPLAGNKFFGSKPFSKCNTYLKSKNLKEINWRNY
jgi:uracil-DNA glycosylase